MIQEGADADSLIERARARGQSGLEAATGGSREGRERSLDQLLTRSPFTRRRRHDVTDEEREVAQLAGGGVIRFCQVVATAVVQGASDEQWSQLETEIADLEERGWEVGQGKLRA